MRTHTITDSPTGLLTLVSTNGVLSGVYMTDQRHRPAEATFGERANTGFEEVITQLNEYFEGKRTDFDLPTAMAGTDFQRRVWTELTRIPYSETISYGQLADRLGKPTASRAVGLANGRNPISIIVPCHRVVGSTGSLTGYGGGVERKRFLLDFERATAGKVLL
ncbi:methylated-DNA--[protein]-cysteine S-methyltransferase [Actinokineospora sp. G85]|uniref:methylated-DNA--[protein]-cysteine S-methyltransferase n=1 Tax=Actinokineospora sp. G85 TaxID=3406626 RepID=UPI003C712B7B